MDGFARTLRAVALGVVLVLTGVVLALALPGSASPGDETTGGPETARFGARRSEGLPPLRPLPLHAEGTFTYADGSTRSFVFDAGLVTAVDASSITLERPDGVEVSVATDGATCVVMDGVEGSLEQIEPGMRAFVNAEGGTATVIRAGLPSRPLRAPVCYQLLGAVHGDLTVTFIDGTTAEHDWDRGMITAIDREAGTVTLIRRDASEVTISYDDTTVVLDEGPSTIDDLAVGDLAVFVSETGADGGLVAKVIRCVMSPGELVADAA